VNRVAAFVERVVRQRRPKPFPPDPDEARMMRIAIELQAAGHPANDPGEEFVEQLKGELADMLGDQRPADRPAGGLLSTRRGLMRAAGIAAAAGSVGAAGGYVAAGGSGGARPSAGSDQVLRPTSGRWQTVATSQELPDGEVRTFDAGTVFGFVGRSGGRVFAVSGVCTHQGCRLALDAPARELKCPCHSAVFMLTGAVISHPRTGSLAPLPRLPVREADGAVQILAASLQSKEPPGGDAPAPRF
jgi:cytochrome b6-f complex iron-sulfur subunit